MHTQLISAICSQVYQQFPETKGCTPKVQETSADQYLLIFKGSARTADGRSLARTVRVVANQNGKIIKMTTSR